MTTWIDDRNVGVKLMANVIVILFGLAIIAAVALVGLRNQMWHDREMRVKVAVGVAEGLAHTIDAQVRNGDKTREQGGRSCSLSCRASGTTGINILLSCWITARS